MKRTFKKAMSVFLVVMMLLGVAPLSGFGFDSKAAAYKVGDIITFGGYADTVVSEYMAAKLAEFIPDDRGVINYLGKNYIRTSPAGINTYVYSTYEPIEWRVLSIDSDGVYIMSERILESRYYDNGRWGEVIWSASPLRTWLNTTFYNHAFTDYEKSRINTTYLLNGDNPAYGTEGGEDTYDKIFIPSLADVLNKAYGFSNSTSSSDTRKAVITNYAGYVAGYKADTYQLWWTRTPGSRSGYCSYVDAGGSIRYDLSSWSSASLSDVFRGVRPALKLNLGSKFYKTKNNTSYSIKTIDDATGMPISGVDVWFGGKSVGMTDINGALTLEIGSDADLNEKVTFTSSDGLTETKMLYELNQYSTNNIRLVNDYGVESLLASLNLPSQTINGPMVNILGLQFPLFSFEAGLSLGEFNIDTEYDAKNKIMKCIIGLGDGIHVDATNNREEYEKKYDDFKNFFNGFNKFSAGERRAAYNKLKSNLKKFKGKVGFDADLTVAGYAEFDVSTGERVLKEGGIVITAEAGVSKDIPWGVVCYSTFSIKGEVEGKLNFQKENAFDEYYVPGGSFGFKVKPSISVGGKIIHKDIASIEGGIEGTFDITLSLPASSFLDSASFKMTAACFVDVKSVFIFDKNLKTHWEKNFLEFELGSNSLSANSFENITIDDFDPISRDYLNTSPQIQLQSFGTQSIENGFNISSVYPYADPQLVRLNDGRIVAVWVYDDGTKSSMNRTTLYYSVYTEGMWSTPSAIYESGFAEEEPKIVTDGENIYALWKRASKEFDDNATIDEMLVSTDLVYAEFADGKWTQPVLVGNSGNGMYPISHGIATNNGSVAITWAEETDAGMDIYIQQNVGGTWGNVSKTATLDNVTSLAVGYIDGTPVIAYSTDADGDSSTMGDGEVYIGSTRLTDNSVDDYGVTYQNGQFYYVSGGYLVADNTVTDLYVGGNYSVISNGTVTAVVYLVADGFKSELYVSYKDADGYTAPVALTSRGQHVSDCSVIIDSKNTIVAAMAINNVNNSATEYPYTSTDFIIDNIGQLADLEMDSDVYYDFDTVCAGGNVTFVTTFKNIGTAKVNGYTLNLKNSDGQILASKVFNDSVASGKTYQADISYTLPEDFNKQSYTIEIVSTDEYNKANNTATVEIGHADIQVLNTKVNDGIITATVANNGYGIAKNVTVSLSQFSNSMVELGNIALGDIAPGEVKQYSYMLPAPSLNFATLYSSNRLVVEAQSASNEMNFVNNTEEILLIPQAVDGITLNTATITIDIGTTQQLFATVTPSDAHNKVVHWVSDATNVATVDEEGNVTAIAKGTAIITAITDDGNFVAQCQVTVNETVRGVSISEEDIDITVGNSIQLIASITPSGASNKKLHWASLDKKVATVSDSGVVTAVKTGTTAITVTTDDGGFSASCTVNVTNPVNGVVLNEKTMTIYNGTSKQLFATVTPLDADNLDLIWSSSNDTIVTVDQNGVVTAVTSTGSTIITVRTVDGGYTASCTVNTGKKVTDVYLSDSQLILAPGLTHQLTATIMPLNALNKGVAWASTNKSVATVDQNGLVTAHKAGTAVIIIETDDGNLSRTCTVTVDNSAQGFELSTHDEYIAVNGTVKLNGKFTPSNAQNKTVIWTTSDSAIATVDANGLVTGKKAGSVVITATTVDGGYKDYCLVRVVGITASYNTSTIIDLEESLIYGLDVGLTSISDYIDLVDDSCTLEYDTLTGEIGTGTITNVVRNGEIIDSYTVVIFGDIDGNGWYDANDAFIVNMIACGLISADRLSEAERAAADCNHDGVIDELDFELLINASVLLDDVDQSATQEGLVTNAFYIDYCSLIDQTAGEEIQLAPDTQVPDSNANQPAETLTIESVFAVVFEFIKMMLSFVFSVIK